MTTEELILGHFEKALTAEQEASLQEALASSPEAQALYDQHAHLDSLMTTDAEALAPSEELNESVVAAALGVLPEAIGGSAALWFSGKFVATVAAVIIGGGSVYLATRGPAPEPVRAKRPVAVRHMDLGSIPLPLPSFDALEIEQPVVVDNNTTTTAPAPARTATAKPSVAMRSAGRSNATQTSATRQIVKIDKKNARLGNASGRVNSK